jgi:hypothetical protein
MSIDDEIKAQNKLHPRLSDAFKRLEEIFVARYQPWCEFSTSKKNTTLSLPYTDDDLRRAVHELHKDELARALVRACIHGDVYIAKLLWGARGPFEIEHEYRGLQEIINGSVVMPSTEAQHTFTNLESSETLAELMEWMPTVGLGFMVVQGDKPCRLLASDDMAFAIKNVAWKSQFQGTLPTLADGVVNQPELLLALKEKAENSAYSKSLNDILVWATPQMIAEFPGELSTYTSRQGLTLESTTKLPGKDPELKHVRFDQCDEALMSQLTRRTLENGETVVKPAVWNYYQLDLNLKLSYGADSTRDHMVLGYLATEPMQFGFDQKPNHVLCRANINFLSQFSIGQVEEGNLRAAHDFTKGYFPLDIVVLDNGPDKQMYGACLRPVLGISMGMGNGSSIGASRLYKLLGDSSSMHHRLREALPRPLVKMLVDLHPNVMMDPLGMLALYQAFGWDNKGLVMRIDASDLQMMQEAGFKFSDETMTRIPAKSGPRGYEKPYERQSGEHTDVFMNLNSEFIRAGSETGEVLPDYLINSYSNAVKVGLWGSETPKPKSLTDALVMAARRKNWGNSNQELALKAYITHAGIEACVKAAKKDSHWIFLDVHFGREALTPHLKLTSRATRGRLLEGDMGL